MRNDFFKHILLSGGSRQNRTELETEVLPYAFNSNGHRLRNYRIYGNTVNGESVGDLVTEGEHTGEYCIPVIVNDTPINIFMQDQLRKIGEKTDHIDYRKQKMYSISRNLWNEEVEAGGISNDGRLIDSTKRIRSDYIDVEPAKTYTFSSNLKIRLIYSYDKDNNRVDVICDSPSGNTSYTFTIPNNAVKIRIALMDRRNNVEYDITINDFQWGQLEEGHTATSYKAYSEITELDISLPAITIDGANTLNIDTTVQPSKIWIQGNISEIETVSTETQALQTNMQSLQPLSLDENAELEPSDKNEFQTNDISEMPVEDENSIEEILETENLETTGDGENAE